MSGANMVNGSSLETPLVWRALQICPQMLAAQYETTCFVVYILKMSTPNLTFARVLGSKGCFLRFQSIRCNTAGLDTLIEPAFELSSLAPAGDLSCAGVGGLRPPTPPCSSGIFNNCLRAVNGPWLIMLWP